MSTDGRIDSYINTLPEWQQTICSTLRKWIHESEPKIEETIKFTNRPYFTLHGNVCALLAAKDHINLFIYDPIAKDPGGLINQGHGNSTARSIQIYEGKMISKEDFIRLIKNVIANNREGGWRKLNK
jgi:hypothetical protein